MVLVERPLLVLVERPLWLCLWEMWFKRAFVRGQLGPCAVRHSCHTACWPPPGAAVGMHGDGGGAWLPWAPALWEGLSLRGVRGVCTPRLLCGAVRVWTPLPKTTCPLALTDRCGALRCWGGAAVLVVRSVCSWMDRKRGRGARGCAEEVVCCLEGHQESVRGVEGWWSGVAR